VNEIFSHSAQKAFLWSCCWDAAQFWVPFS